MRLLAINVRAGGASAKIDQLIERALEHQAGVYVFTEYRDNEVGMHLRQEMRRYGFPHLGHSNAFLGNGVLVAAREPFRTFTNIAGLPDDSYPNAMVECIFRDLHLIGVYLPGQDRKQPHLEYLIRYARAMDEQKANVIVIGDFNSGRNETDIEANVGRKRPIDTFSTAPLYEILESRWKEAWSFFHPKKREFTWYPDAGRPTLRNGWRLDKALISTALLPRLRGAYYDHSFRLDALTDHSALIIDLADLDSY